MLGTDGLWANDAGSLLPQAECGPNDHREDAPHINTLKTVNIFKYLFQTILEIADDHKILKTKQENQLSIFESLDH